jgi:hypothetical protein
MNFNFNVGKVLFSTKIIGYKYTIFCKFEDFFSFEYKEYSQKLKLVGFGAKSIFLTIMSSLVSPPL